MNRAYSLFRTSAKVSLRVMLMCGAAVAVTTAAANAQDASPSEDMGEIVVTGSSIRGVAPVGAPLTMVTSEEIQAAAVANTADFMRTMPQVVNLGADEGRGGTVGNAQINTTEGTGINLRGLGTESTLVLLDGGRIAPSGAQANYYDISAIPTNAISRVEVVTDGASAIYGSDAVGGVVNLITKTGEQPLSASARYGQGDGFHDSKFNVSVGKTWKALEVFAAYEHFLRTPLLGSERAVVTQDLRPFGGPNLRANFGSPGTIIAGGRTYAIPAGQNGRSLTAAQLTAGTQNFGDINDARSLLADQARSSFLLNASLSVSDNVEIWYRGHYSSREFKAEGINLNSGAATAALNVPRSNPFFVNPADPAATSVTVNYSFINDMRPYADGFERGYSNAVGGAFDIATWRIDASLSRDYNKAQRNVEGSLRIVNLAGALADSNPATAFNPFCDGNNFQCNNADTIARLNGFALVSGQVDMTDAVVKASGPLFTLPGGEVRAAVGYQFIDQDYQSINRRNTNTADPLTLAPGSQREINATFAEVFIPVIGEENALPGIRRLELSIAARDEEFSDFGKTFNPKYGVAWSPIDDLNLKATYGTSFRAPTLGDLAVAASASYQIVNLVDASGTTIRGLQLLGSRAGLAPEKADIWSFGFDWSPAGIPGLKTSANYYDIALEDRLVTLSAAQIFQNEQALAAFIVRSPSAALVQSYYASPFFQSTPEPTSNIRVIVDTRRNNVAGVTQKGLDLAASYSFEAAGSEWTMGATTNIVLEAKQSLGPGLPFNSVLNTINNPIEVRGRAHLGWRRGSWELDAFANYVGGYINNSIAPAQDVDRWITADLGLAYTVENDGGLRWADGLRIGLSATNLFDEAPPLVFNTTVGNQGAYDSQNASALGRVVAVELSKSW